MRVALGIEYDGSDYHGWQKQKTEQSIQCWIEKALSKIANTAVSVVCAGRTDAGVHALEQIVHFDSEVVREPRAWFLGANTQLPKDIRVLWAKHVGPDFHARYSAIARYYRYIIRDGPVRSALRCTQETWCYHPLDIHRMQKAADFLVGKHNFSSFRGQHCQSRSPIRKMYRIDVSRQADCVTIDFVANAFLYHMVRNMVGVLLKIGVGKAQPEWALDVLSARDRQAADVTALPHGLYLAGVCYPKEFGLPAHQIFISLPGLDSYL